MTACLREVFLAVKGCAPGRVLFGDFFDACGLRAAAEAARATDDFARPFADLAPEPPGDFFEVGVVLATVSHLFSCEVPGPGVCSSVFSLSWLEYNRRRSHADNAFFGDSFKAVRFMTVRQCEIKGNKN